MFAKVHDEKMTRTTCKLVCSLCELIERTNDVMHAHARMFRTENLQITFKETCLSRHSRVELN
jgi:hypothetical protein